MRLTFRLRASTVEKIELEWKTCLRFSADRERANLLFLSDRFSSPRGLFGRNVVGDGAVFE